jgi:regulation of enolase protein 1 (concanavalin A-like superfamily)
VGADDGTLSGDVTWTTGTIGGALTFDNNAGGARVSIPDEGALDFSRDRSFTVTAWVQPASTVGQYSDVISKSRADPPWYELGIDPANNWVFRGPESDVEGTPVVPGWHHLAAVQDGAAGTRSLFVDGVRVATGAAQAADGTGELVFGAADGVNERFSGSLEDVRIYDRPLAASEVATLAQTTWTDSDIGAVGVAGSAIIYDGCFTDIGSGADIWGDADGFHYIYQKVSGDCVITARVTSVEDTDPWAKVGVMIRETLDPGSAFADFVESPGNGMNFQWRQVANHDCTGASGVSDAARYWVRLIRTGNVIAGYESPDGNAWTEIGSETFTIAANVYVGLCTTSHDDTRRCRGLLDNVSVSTGEVTAALSGTR